MTTPDETPNPALTPSQTPNQAQTPAELAPSPAPRVVIDVTIAAPIAHVWQALRDPARLAQWFGWDYDKLAEEIDVIFKTYSTEVEPGRRLQMGGDVFELEAVGSATRVRLVRAEAPASDTWDGVYDDMDEGWRTFIAQLAFWLELQHGVDRAQTPRRTIYLAGHREHDGGPGLIAAAGLCALASLVVGERYEATAITGERLAGVVRFRTEHQLGLSVDGWGPGMLVLAGRPPSDKSPHGGGFALITTFGASDEGLDRLTQGWAAAWRGAFTRVTLLPA